jgi:hypothetical protein
MHLTDIGTETEYPEHLRTAIEHLLNDQGNDGWDPEKVTLPIFWEDNENGLQKINWKRVNTFLGTLDDEHLEMFCIGDQDDIMGIVSEHGEEAEYTHRVMDLLFESIGT